MVADMSKKMPKLTLDAIKTELDKDSHKIIFLYRWLNDVNCSWEASEELSRYLLEDFKILEKSEFFPILNNQKVRKRDKRGWIPGEYRSATRTGAPISQQSNYLKDSGKPKRGEEYLAMTIFNQGRCPNDAKTLHKINDLGFVLDYQMPIGGSEYLLLKPYEANYRRGKPYDLQYTIPDPYSESGLFKPGKCDLITFDGKQFRILELKMNYNREPLLRAVLEAYTYLKMLDTDMATKSFRQEYSGYKNVTIPEGMIPWKAAVLLHRDGTQYEEYKKEGSKLRKLMNNLDIVPIWYRSEFYVVE